MNGILYFISPNWKKLLDIKVSVQGFNYIYEKSELEFHNMDERVKPDKKKIVIIKGCMYSLFSKMGREFMSAPRKSFTLKYGEIKIF